MKHLFLIAGLALSPLSVTAQSVSASDPESVSFALQSLGIETQSGTQENGAPVLVSQLSGVTFTVLFYNCDGPRGCQDLQLRATYAPDTPVALDRLNDWNRAAFIGKAYQSDDTVILKRFQRSLNQRGFTAGCFSDSSCSGGSDHAQPAFCRYSSPF